MMPLSASAEIYQFDFQIVTIAVPHISQSANNHFWKPQGALNITRQVAYFHHEMHTGHYFMTYAPRLYSTFDDKFLPLSPLAPQFPNFAIQILLFRLKHTVPVVTHAHVLQGFYITDVYGALLAKHNVQDQNWRGYGPGEHPTKLRTPYLFLQPLKLATSNLVHNLGLGVAYQETTFRTKIGRCLGQWSIQKNLDPLLISATIEASNFKFHIQLGFGSSLPSTMCRTKIGGGLGQGTSETFGTH